MTEIEPGQLSAQRSGSTNEKAVMSSSNYQELGQFSKPFEEILLKVSEK